nr:hypothetical protein HmN_000608200 [Hymenolepis microstoma]
MSRQLNSRYTDLAKYFSLLSPRKASLPLEVVRVSVPKGSNSLARMQCNNQFYYETQPQIVRLATRAPDHFATKWASKITTTPPTASNIASPGSQFFKTVTIPHYEKASLRPQILPPLPYHFLTTCSSIKRRYITQLISITKRV